jgi:cytochrome c oxidase assembly factor CtaG
MDKHAHDHANGMAHGGMGHAEAAEGLWWFPAWWDAPLLVVLITMLAAYLFLLWRTSREERSGADKRSALAFILGLTVVFVGISSPFVFLRAGSHLGYMVQLELLMSLSPPLLLLGLRPVLGLLPEGRFTSGLSRLSLVPALTLLIWLLVIYAWHIPTLHMMGRMGTYSQVVYPVQLASYVVAGLLFWWPIIGPVERFGGMRLPGKLGYLALAQVGAALLAALLIFYPHLIYDHGPITQPFGLSAMTDQKVSGVAMMVVDMMVASTVAGWLVLRSLERSLLRTEVRQLSPEVDDG